MGRRESYSGDLARVAKRASYAPELASVKSTWRAPRPASWPPPLPADRVPVPLPARTPWAAASPPATTEQFSQSAVHLRAAPPYLAPVGYAQAAPNTLSPQAVRATTSWRDVGIDDNPFAHRSRGWRRARWTTFLVVMALVGGAATVAKVRPQAIPPGVAQSLGRYAGPTAHWMASTALPALAQARAFVVERVAPTPHGESLAQSLGSTPLGAPSDLTAAVASPVAAAVVPVSAKAPSPTGAASDPPVVDVSTLPVAHAERAAEAASPKPAARATPASLPYASAPRAAPRAAAPEAKARPARAADDDEAPVAKVVPVAKVAPPPVVNAAPPPAPGSLDDLIRKAVEADAKKKH